MQNTGFIKSPSEIIYLKAPWASFSRAQSASLLIVILNYFQDTLESVSAVASDLILVELMASDIL